MWSNIFTESSYQYNFNIGFSTLKSDVIIHLAQWQYWWWFWFSLVWTLYYYVILKTIRFRVLKMKPKLSTTYRPHGKWGDFLACIIPLTWCINILVNSNLILRLIEWQNESSLFTVRVRSKQWYWIYKFELKSIFDILSTPKNIGYNKWRYDFSSDYNISNNYLELIQNRSNNSWIKSYWEKTIQSGPKINKYNIITPQEQFRTQLNNQINFNKTLNNCNYRLYDLNYFFNKEPLEESIKLINKDYKIKFLNKFSLNNSFNIEDNTNYNKSNLIRLEIPEKLSIRRMSLFNFMDILNKNLNKLDFNFILKSNLFKFNSKLKNYNLINSLYFNNLVSKYNLVKKFNHDDIDEMDRWFRKSYGLVSPLRFIKLDIKKNQNINTIEIFKFRFNIKSTEFTNKIISNNIYLSLIQKRYNRKKNINPQIINFKDELGINLKKIKYNGKPYLNENKIFKAIPYDYNILYKLIKKNKTKNELISVVFARRLLRTKKTLVLPAHVNITIITNSYDIVHSWFIPGLGIKLDCVPGRSTHHTFFIDNVGFYYGQCAEICGRYHHHMPIRICALPFEHFLIWWTNYGLPKMLNTFKKKNYELKYSFRKYSW